MKRVYGLDLVRAIAIMLVLTAHYAKGYGICGYLGVEIFFALSGYLIGGILLRGLQRAESWQWSHVTNFWLRRWWRTLPNYWLFLLVALLFHSWAGGGASPWLLLAHIGFMQDAIAADPQRSFYGQSWSLCVEEWFYFTAPILLWIFSRFTRSTRFAWYAMLTVIIAGAITLRWFVAQNLSMEDVRKITYYRLDAIGYGVVVAGLGRFLKTSAVWRAISGGGGLALFILSLPLLNDFGPQPSGPLRVLGLLLPALGSALMLPAIERWEKAPIWVGAWWGWTVQKVSAWSYSIYLSHIAVLWTTYRIAGTGDVLITKFLIKCTAFVMTLIISGLIYELYERRVTQTRPCELTG